MSSLKIINLVLIAILIFLLAGPFILAFTIHGKYLWLLLWTAFIAPIIVVVLIVINLVAWLKRKKK
ncbi:MAG: hypothetical protein QXQ18_01390 [Candidatus Aenigmatarchaeota archaeon]